MKTKLMWQKCGGFTPGGDPCYMCPICGKSEHIYGIESLWNFKTECENCGVKLKYPKNMKGKHNERIH